MAHIESYKTRAAGFRHEEYEQEAMTRVNQQWSEAISPDVVVAVVQGTDHGALSNRATITRKLQSIIIDKVNFDKLDIATSFSSQRKRARSSTPTSRESISFCA